MAKPRYESPEDVAIRIGNALSSTAPKEFSIPKYNWRVKKADYFGLHEGMKTEKEIEQRGSLFGGSGSRAPFGSLWNIARKYKAKKL